MKVKAKIVALEPETGLEDLDLKILEYKEITVGNMTIEQGKELPEYNEMI